MRIAVTGGSGRIGTVVAKKLIERGHQVTILDKKAPSIDGVRFVFIDLRNRELLQPILEQCDAVVHLGEIPNQSAGESPHDVYCRNTAGGSTVLQVAADLKLQRVLYTSSAQVYGIWGDAEAWKRLPITKFPIDETQPLAPVNPYGLAKVANETYAEILARRQNLSVAIFRLPAVMQPQWAKRWVEWVRKTPDFYKEEFDGLWTFVHAEDVAECYALALEKPRPGCEAYHLVAPDILGNVPLSERIAMCNATHWPAVPTNWPETASLVTSAKAMEHFGWEPKYTFARIIAEADAASASETAK